MNLKELPDKELARLWNQRWIDFVQIHRRGESSDEASARYVEVRAEIVERGLGTLERPPSGFTGEEENIHDLTDKEVFSRVLPASTKKAIGSVVLVGLTYLTARFFSGLAYDLTWLFLVCLAIDVLIVLWGTILESVLIVLYLAGKGPHRSKYDVGATAIRLVEGGVVFACGYILFTRFIRP